MESAKNQTPYMVENQWYERAIRQSKASMVSATAEIGMPTAETACRRCVCPAVRSVS